MYNGKRVLLIAGGGTLGSYVAKELLAKGAYVDVICLEDNTSDNDRLRYFKHRVSLEVLSDLFKETRYDGVVDFIHYTDIEEYKPFYELIMKNTEQLIFLSSYRVYADSFPITENAPRLLDVSEDKEFLENEDYAIPKAKFEDFLFGSHKGERWTIVRPVISFSFRRFDLFVYSNNDIWEQVERYGRLLMPSYAKDLVAGIDWAGNSGKLIANLLFKEEAIGEVFTVSSAQNLTWGRVSEIYSEVFGFDVEWCDTKVFEESYPCLENKKKWLYVYDRKFNRLIDNSKILSVTGLSSDDFLSFEDGLKIERELRGNIK